MGGGGVEHPTGTDGGAREGGRGRRGWLMSVMSSVLKWINVTSLYGQNDERGYFFFSSSKGDAVVFGNECDVL